MSTIHAAAGLHYWTLELEDGSTRHVLASSLGSAIYGMLPSPVVGARRGIAADVDRAPVLSSLTPTSAQLGTPSFTLHVFGDAFFGGESIIWNGSPEPTTRVSETELTTEVNMATAEVAMAIPVAVRTLAGKDSNVLTFELQEAA